MNISPKKLAILDAVLKAQNAGYSQIEAAKKKREEIATMGFVAEESDPLFQSSPAASIRTEDVNLVRALPHLLQTIEKQKGPKGDKGDSIKGDKGDSIVGPKGDQGPSGKDGVANMDDVEVEIEQEMQDHLEEFDHKLIHDPKMIGTYELDESTLQEGDLLQVKGKKLVGVKIQMPDINGLRTWVSSQGVSNVRSYPVTANRELEPFILWIVDATAGDLTLTIPSASGRENAWFEMIRIDPTSNVVTVQATGSETFSGETSYLLQQFTDLQLFAYNGSYLIRQAT